MSGPSADTADGRGSYRSPSPPIAYARVDSSWTMPRSLLRPRTGFALRVGIEVAIGIGLRIEFFGIGFEVEAVDLDLGRNLHVNMILCI